MIDRDELGAYLHEYLTCGDYQDYAPNGMQVEGKQQIKKLCTAVTASAAVIKQAIAQHADALMVHHGYFWRGESLTITGMQRERLGLLINNDINLFAYHLPLDCHLDLGNNACLAKLFAVKNVQQHTVNHITNVLWTGNLKKSVAPQEFCDYLSSKLLQAPQAIVVHDKPIERIAWCSGAAQDFIEQAKRLGVDAYISGEISERTYYQATELGIHYYACGHHATERYGVQALGNHVSALFGLEHQFIDSKNPV